MKTVSDNAYRLDGNNVDPEIEMAKLAETKMAYNGIMRMMGKRAEMLKTAMSGG
jgi:flagellar basal-body rod protein FlgB